MRKPAFILNQEIVTHARDIWKSRNWRFRLAAITTLSYKMDKFEVAKALDTYVGVVEKYLKVKELVKKNKDLLKKDKVSEIR